MKKADIRNTNTPSSKNRTSSKNKPRNRNADASKSPFDETDSNQYNGFEPDWFRLETRVREMLSDGLENIVNSLEGNGMNILENKSSINSVKIQIDDIMKKYSQINKIKMIESSLMRIDDFEGELKNCESRMKKETCSVINMVENVSAMVTNLREENDSLTKYVHTLKDDINNHEGKMLQQKQDINNKINESERRMLRNNEMLIKRVNVLETNSKITVGSLENNKRAIESAGASIATVASRNKELDEQVMNMVHSKLDVDQFEVLRKHVKQDTNYALVAFEKMNTKMKDTHNYINLYNPLKDFEAIMKSLDYVL